MIAKYKAFAWQSALIGQYLDVARDVSVFSRYGYYKDDGGRPGVICVNGYDEDRSGSTLLMPSHRLKINVPDFSSRGHCLKVIRPLIRL